MQLEVHDSLQHIGLRDWNTLNLHHNPFLRYEFFDALEKSQCVGAHSGWIPQYVTAHENNQLIAVVPMFIKHHSYGEYIFDWAWAQAYERHGLAYYPKLVIGVPFTPATGSRILLHPLIKNPEKYAKDIIDFCQQHAKKIGASSIHCLFSTEDENRSFTQQGFMPRLSNQFHWCNQDYTSFDDYLSVLTSRHRKKIKRERQRVTEQGITLKVNIGDNISPEQWQHFYHFYQTTCYDKGGVAYLNATFFELLAAHMPENLMLITAHTNERIVACALFLFNDNTLYGRYWGSDQAFHSLHFETCYYKPIEYCIQHSITNFEAGAQGEHKLSRGFLPTPIYSTHWIADDTFRDAIAHFLRQEKQFTSHYQDELNKHSPFKATEQQTGETSQ